MTSEARSPDPSAGACGVDRGVDSPSGALPPHDVMLDERGTVCPMPVIALARALRAAPHHTVLLLADDPAAASDVPAWCGLQSRLLLWSGPAPDGRGLGFVIAPGPVSPAGETPVTAHETQQEG